MLWKYGLAPVRTQNLMHTAIGKFLRMYQPPYFPFSDLTVTAADVGLLETTGVTGQQLLAKNGLDGHFAEEIIQASTRVNYASNLGLIHGLETLVCMAATEGLQIAGGNWQIFKKMLDSSKAKVHKSTVVSKLEKTPKGTWRVYSSPADANGGSHVRVTEFDAVILATPYQYAEIEISPAPVKVPDTIPYASLHVTLFTSPNKLSPKYFGMLEGQGVPGVILTTLNATEQKNEAIKRGEGIHGVGNVGFYSISTLREIKKAGQPVEYLYKVFSPDDFTNERINKIIGVEGAGSEKITWTHRKIVGFLTDDGTGNSRLTVLIVELIPS